MNGSWTLTKGVLALLALISLAIVAIRREPKFEGLGWSYWLEELHTCNDDRREHAQVAFHAMGEALVPVLVRALRRQDSALAKLNSKWGHKLPLNLRGRLPRPGGAETVRARAAEGLSLLGASASVAVPDLVRALRDRGDEVVVNSAEALGRIGPAARDAVPALTEMLADTLSLRRVAAAQALGRIGPEALFALPVLIDNLEAGSPLVRASAAMTLGKLGGVASLAVDSLIELTRDADDYVRTCALLALGKLGASEPKAINALIVALRDASPPVRICAVEALGEIGPLAKPAIPAMINAQLCDQSGLGRFVAVALNRIDPENYAVGIRE